MTDSRTIAFYDDQIDAYVELVDALPQDPTLSAFLTLLPAGARVLDLGCGPGHCAARMRDCGFQVDATDASAEMVRLANETFDLGARQAEFKDLAAHSAYAAIWANFSLLHARAEDFPDLLGALYSALEPKGLLHISMKLGEGTARDKLGRYYAYYSQAQLQDLLQGAGFVVEQVETGELMGLAGESEPWIALLARK